MNGNNTALAAESGNAAAAGRELSVLFEAADITLAVPYCRVREITAYSRPVPVPRAPAYLKGIINYCGQVCPLVSISAAGGVPEKPASDRTRIIMLEAPADSSALIGLIAENFLGSVGFAPDAVLPYEGPSGGLLKPCITGIVHLKHGSALVFRPYVFLETLDHICLK